MRETETATGLPETRPFGFGLLDVDPEWVGGSDGVPLVEETLVDWA